MLAGEIQSADTVGVEFLLPDLGLGLQAKAVVRHQSPLRCGFEFQGLTRHQQAVIREWSRQLLNVKAQPPAAVAQSSDPPRSQPFARRPSSQQRSGLRRLAWPAAALLALAVLLIWLRWQRGWKELEDQLPRTTGAVTAARPLSPKRLLQSGPVLAKSVQDDRTADGETANSSKRQ
jgi:hypothetical protein